MTSDKDRIEAIGGGAFLDDDGDVATRTFRSGGGRIREGAKGDSAGFAQMVCGPDGRLGWRVAIPGGRPLATPGVRAGRVFVGGGFGSHEFHALDATSGGLLWTLRTRDDGPTAATVSDGIVAFNTESCTVYVVEAATGRAVWMRWLGDPLMAQTAIAGDLVLMAYPGADRRHRLAALELRTGKTVWETEIVSDVITAPIVAEGSVWATTLEGTVYRIELETGRCLWASQHLATSAPWVHGGRIFVSLRESAKDPASGGRARAVEGWDTVVMGTGARGHARSSGRRFSPYLERGQSEAAGAFFKAQDAAVGFGAAPASAKLHLAQAQLGIDRVASVWSYQGSRPEVFDDGIFGVLGDAIQCLDLGTKKARWRTRLEFDKRENLGRVLSPPAVTARRLYVVSTFGDLAALDRATGEPLWALNVGAPVLAQPAVAEGKVFLGTADGTLYAFQADDDDPVGWPQWGGGEGHNGA